MVKPLCPMVSAKKILAIILFCLPMALCLVGCETKKGLQRDLQNLKISDAWFREHYW